MTIRVLLVDGHQLVRDALRDTLANEPDITVVGEAGDAYTAFEHALSLAPDVVVLDTGLPDLNGIEAAGRLKGMTGVEMKIVALSAHVDRLAVRSILRAGAAAYVTKSSADAELLPAIRAVVSGHNYLCLEAAESLAADA